MYDFVLHKRCSVVISSRELFKSEGRYIMIPQIIMTIEDDSERAFITHLYGKYRKLMYYTAVKYLRDHKLAEEVIHDTLITLIGKVDVLRQKEESILPAYLVVCVKRACFNCLKRKKVEKRIKTRLMNGTEK